MSTDNTIHQSASLRRKPRLADTVKAALAADIRDGVFPVGSKLPAEPMLIERFGVSRTVIREAVAEMRASGLVRPVHGAGVFVEGRKGLDAEAVLTVHDLQSVPQVIEMLEYRAGLECQAAMLAAARATPAEIFALLEAHERIEALVRDRRMSFEADRDFHMVIARATHNQLFPRALQAVGATEIPWSQLANRSLERDENNFELVVEEHRAIVEAIVKHSPDMARKAMQLHLVNSQRRYEAFARAAISGLGLAPLAAGDGGSR
ncbi:FadR/GntR family transcriptional regulator [Rhizobium panacihumi]|uniref:FadR/GntR family transcriptional regulator n=1 Tax=Rhizobium panacihumi TaxID=2008450 RepID=UPI003D78E801